MNILHLSTSDIGGGAARAAYRLHSGLGLLGHESRMLVLKKQGDDKSVTKLNWSDDYILRFKRSRLKKKIERDFTPYKFTLPPGFEIFSDDRSDTAFDLNRQIPTNVDLINLHWIAGLIDHQSFFSSIPATLPLVWRLADMAPLTGGCHYDLGCGKFALTCGSCPVLGSNVDTDLSRQVWGRKHSVLSKINPEQLQIVGTSRWIADQARKSSLLNRFPITVIPNGLNTTDFSPRDKRFSRDTLGVPQDAKVVLFVADSAAIVRKGFDYLAAALSGMKDRRDLFLLSVGGSKPNVPDIAQLHLGKISNDRMLSVIYSAADVFVIPSLQESFGQTVTESMACGTPVVGFDTGGIPDMVRPGVTGYLAPVKDSTALREAIGRMLDDPIKSAEMGKNCREIVVAEYSLAVQANAYANLYQERIAVMRNAPPVAA